MADTKKDRKQTSPALKKISDNLQVVFGEMKIFFYLFRKENVFRYFMFILIIMIVFAAIFWFLEYDTIIQQVEHPDDMTLFQKIVTTIYWSAVTITTVGYGDYSPTTTAGRIIVIFMMFLSLGTVSLFTANLASALTTKKLLERRGIMSLSDLKDHYLILGWKTAMNHILDEIIQSNPDISLKKIIIIAGIEPDTIEVFYQQYPEYQDVVILRGEPNNETLLRKANLTKTRRILILSDESAPASVSEIDSRTVMTAMTIRAVSPDVKVSAELLDMKFEKYLKSAHIDDIIYTNEYSKVLIANSFAHVGLIKIINQLLGTEDPANITTEPIPGELIGKNIGELKKHSATENSILIGILENVGSFIERKEEAIRDAQKTADVTKLITNLKQAK